MGTEVYASRECVINVLNPIDGTTIKSVPYLGDVGISDRPKYAQRGYNRSAAQGGPMLRALGAVTLKKNVESLEVFNILKAWRYGVLQFAAKSDLKGRRWRYPHIQLVMSNADGSQDIRTAYDCRLSDSMLSRPEVGPVTELMSFDSLGGIDTPGADHYEPTAPLVFFRTGTKTFVNTAGTLTTAADGQAAFGLPYVNRRNLIPSSGDFSGWAKSNATIALGQDIAPDSTILAAHPYLKGAFSAALVTITASGSNYVNNSALVSVAPSTQYTVSWFIKRGTIGTLAYKITDQAGSNLVGQTVYTGSVVTSGYTRVSFTFATGVGTSSIKIWPQVDVGSTGTFWIFGLQLEQGSTATNYQPTNASGVDLANPINGAGLALEGAGVNLTSDPQAETMTGQTSYTQWGNVVASSVGLTNSVAPFVGTNCVYVNGPALSPGQYVNAGYYQNSITFKQNTYYTFSVYAKASGPGCAVAFYLGGASAGYVFINIDDWQNWKRYTYTYYHTGATGAEEAHLYAAYIEQSSRSVYLDCGQIEESPFVTSWMNPSRNADQCGLVSPHNLLKYSEQLDNPAWTKVACSITPNATPGPDGTMTADYLACVTPSGRVEQLVPVTAGKTYTLSRWAKKSGTASPKLWINWQDVNGATILDTTSNPAASSGGLRDALTATAPAGAVNALIRVFASDQASLQDATISQIQLVEGSHPGPYVRTTDRAISKPVDGGLDPFWVQNGYIEFDILLPAYGGRSGSNFMYFGSTYGASSYLGYGAKLALYQFPSNTNFLTFDRSHNGAGGRGFIEPAAGSIFDGAKHRVRLSWTNYVLGGLRVMMQEMWVDGVKVGSRDAALTYGASLWDLPDVTTLISNGYVYGTLSNLVIGYPPLPAGGYAEQRAA